MPRPGQPRPSPGGIRCCRIGCELRRYGQTVVTAALGARGSPRAGSPPPRLLLSGLGAGRAGLFSVPPERASGWGSAARHGPRSCPAASRAVNELEPAKTALGPA